MSDQVAQSYGNHRRTVVGFHIVLGLILLAILVYQIVMAVKAVSLVSGRVAAGFGVLNAVALLLIFWYVRSFPKVVQDRVIRLEEMLRFQRVLPPNLQSRIGEFTPGQFVGLRFAGDKELPALAQKVLDEKVTSREAIKKLIKDWRPDHLRV